MVGGLVGFALPALAHANDIAPVTSCAIPAGTGYVVTWTVGNDYNLAETGTVTSVTGGLAGIAPESFSISASGNGSGGMGSTPYKTVTLTQTLPASASGTVTLDIQGTWSDGYVTTDPGVATLPTTCQLPLTQTLAGHIYLCPGGTAPSATEVTGGTLCSSGTPSTTQVPGGTLGASGRQNLSVLPSPIALTDVMAGVYSMTATAPPVPPVAPRGRSSAAVDAAARTDWQAGG